MQHLLSLAIRMFSYRDRQARSGGRATRSLHAATFLAAFAFGLGLIVLLFGG